MSIRNCTAPSRTTFTMGYIFTHDQLRTRRCHWCILICSLMFGEVSINLLPFILRITGTICILSIITRSREHHQQTECFLSSEGEAVPTLCKTRGRCANIKILCFYKTVPRKRLSVFLTLSSVSWFCISLFFVGGDVRNQGAVDQKILGRGHGHRGRQHDIRVPHHEPGESVWIRDDGRKACKQCYLYVGVHPRPSVRQAP